MRTSKAFQLICRVTLRTGITSGYTDLIQDITNEIVQEIAVNKVSQFFFFFAKSKTKKFLREIQHLHVIKVDMVNKFVIKMREEYEDKMLWLLDDDTSYRKIERDMTITMEKKNNRKE
ncbi:hypothetical protein WA026_020991 [Henosepilachna vigintioctopunctata]|uniref:Uncharacterized protein n=1 Tax=Henosepilachna vigintioctopunctata TaxID=420089 RepID=A0AAW1VGW1_9CUCU